MEVGRYKIAAPFMIFKFSMEISGAKEGDGDAMPRRSSVGALVLNASMEKRVQRGRCS